MTISRRSLLKLGSAIAAALPFARLTQRADAASLTMVGLVAAHPVGKTKLYSNTTPKVFVTRTGLNSWVAFDNICTHAGAQCVLQGKQTAFCRSHGASFDLKTGKPTGGPARTPLQSHSVTIRKGKIYVSI